LAAAMAAGQQQQRPGASDINHTCVWSS
jgi:hypothetical protein